MEMDIGMKSWIVLKSLSENSPVNYLKEIQLVSLSRMEDEEANLT
jgi:hypothetical protein